MLDREMLRTRGYSDVQIGLMDEYCAAKDRRSEFDRRATPIVCGGKTEFVCVTVADAMRLFGDHESPLALGRPTLSRELVRDFGLTEAEIDLVVEFWAAKSRLGELDVETATLITRRDGHLGFAPTTLAEAISLFGEYDSKPTFDAIERLLKQARAALRN